MVPWPLTEFYAYYLRVFRKRVTCAFGTLTLTTCIPEIGCYVWQCHRSLATDDSNFQLEFKATASGPFPMQSSTFQLLESTYDKVLNLARALVKKHQNDAVIGSPLTRSHDWSPRLKLEKIFFYHEDLIRLDYIVDDLLDDRFEVFIRRDLSLAMSGWLKRTGK